MSSSARFIPLVLLLASCGGSKASAPASPAIAEARKLLEEAGYPGGRGFPKLEVLYNTAESHKRIAAAIQEMWRKELGIEVTLRNEEWKVFLGSRAAAKYQIARGGYTGEYRDPQAFLSLFTSDSGFNSSGWSSPQFDGILQEADRMSDPAVRYDILALAERHLLKEGPIFPIYHYVSHNFLKPFVKGVHPNYRDLHPLQGVTLEGPGAPADGVLIFYAGAEPGSLDPALSHDIRGLKTLMHLFEGLCSYDPRDASPIPGAAERWEVSPDGLTYTFHLREAAWSNGDPLTAEDFAWSWRRVADPATASVYKDRIFFVKNGRAVAAKEKPVDALGVRADGPRKLVVDLERPAPYFPQLLCLNVFFPVHRATVEKHGNAWTRPEHLVHNGPYRLVEWAIGNRQVFEANPRYRAPAEVKLRKFIWLTGDSTTTAFNLYETGDCHWIYEAPIERMDELLGRPDHLPAPYNTAYFYVFNVRVKPLDDPRVRRALSLAVDREKITKFVLRGGETPADVLTPPLIPGYDVKK